MSIFIALTLCDERSIPEDDGVVGDLELPPRDDGRCRRSRRRLGELTDQPEEDLDLDADEGRGGLVHDQDARFACEGPGDLDDLLLSEPKVSDERLRIEVLGEPSHQLTTAFGFGTVVDDDSPRGRVRAP